MKEISRDGMVDVELEVRFANEYMPNEGFRAISSSAPAEERDEDRRGEARRGGARRDAEKEPGKFNSRSLYLIIFYIGF